MNKDENSLNLPCKWCIAFAICKSTLLSSKSLLALQNKCSHMNDCFGYITSVSRTITEAKQYTSRIYNYFGINIDE